MRFYHTLSILNKFYPVRSFHPTKSHSPVKRPEIVHFDVDIGANNHSCFSTCKIFLLCVEYDMYAFSQSVFTNYAVSNVVLVDVSLLIISDSPVIYTLNYTGNYPSYLSPPNKVFLYFNSSLFSSFRTDSVLIPLIAKASKS